MIGIKYRLVLHSFRLFPSLCFHQTAVVHKFDKYSLGKNSSWKFREKLNKTSDKGYSIFQLDPPNLVQGERRGSSVRQKALGNALQDAVNAVLSSRDVPLELQTCSVEVTQMEVSRDSSYVLAYWKVENEGKEVFVETLLKENIDQIRMVLPTYHHLTHTPMIRFVKDEKESYLRRLETLFNYCSKKDS